MLDFPTRSDRLGLGYLQRYDKHGVWHPGVDFNFGDAPNADLGQTIAAPTYGIVKYISPKGYNGGLGEYLVLFHPYHAVWSRYLHLQDIFVSVGQSVARGLPIALLGDSGTTTAHLHFEALNDKGHTFIKNWERPYGRYPVGLPKNTVASMFIDPIKWIEENDHPTIAAQVTLEKRLAQMKKALARSNGARAIRLQRAIVRLMEMIGSVK